jgi:hypothetical protein
MIPKRSFFLVALAILSLALIGADAVYAAGLNLGWGAYCPTSPSSMVDVSDPCDGSTQARGVVYTLIGSFSTNISLTNVIAEDFFVDLVTNSPQLGDYWKLEDENQPGQTNLAGCRGTNSINGNQGSLSVAINDAAFPTVFTGCTKFWGDNPTGGINYGVLIPDNYPGIPAPNRARLIGHFAKSPGTPLTAGVQYGAFVATIDTNHQVLDPSHSPSYVCAGCSDHFKIDFNEVDLYQPPGTPNGDVIITTAGRSEVTWQGGFIIPDPVHRSTWGQVKSLYR